MKTRETKAKDLAAITESLQKSKSAMVVSFSKVTVSKDQEFRNSLREAGASYQVVKNTLARIAVKGTQFEDATEHFKGVTAIAWTENDPVVLSKAISKFMKDNADIYTFKTGVVEGKLVNLTQLTTIANLPSKEELISKLMWVLNSGAQRLVTVINAVPRDLAVVIKQIGEQKPADAAAVEVKADEPAPAPAVEEAAPTEAEVSAGTPAAEDAPAVETAPAEAEISAESTTTEDAPPVEAAADEPEPVEATANESSEAPIDAASTEEAPEVEVEAATAETTESADDSSEDIAPEADAEEKAE